MATKAKPKSSTPASKRRLDAKLDEALDETFPASDPIAVGGVTSTEPAARPVDRRAPLMDPDDVAAARRQRKGANPT